MLPTLQLTTWRHPIYDGLVSFQVWSVCVYTLLGGGVKVLNHDRSGSSSRQDGNSTGQDEKCDQQTVEIHNRREEPRSGYRVMEGR